MDIVSGEKIQQLADVYLGTYDDFLYNPVITSQPSKWLPINTIPSVWNNPSLLFCYSHRAGQFAHCLGSLQNDCVLLFTNSDENMTYDLCKPFLESEKVKHIFCQNLSFVHPKASWIPIGLANSMWPHGNPDYIESIRESILAGSLQKSERIFCSFSVATNQYAREQCLASIQKLGITNHQFSSQLEYITVLSEHKYAICPEGNGLDTHRFWEALFVQTIPIVVRNPLVEQIQSSGIPCVLITSWETFDPFLLPDYASFVFDDVYAFKLSFSNFREAILNQVSLCKDLNP